MLSQHVDDSLMALFQGLGVRLLNASARQPWCLTAPDNILYKSFYADKLMKERSATLLFDLV